MLTRKVFEALAHELNQRRPSNPHDHLSGYVLGWDMELYDAQLAMWHDMVEAVAQGLREANPRFDKDRFFKACGLTL